MVEQIAYTTDSARPDPSTIALSQPCDRLGPAFLIYFHIVVCCISLVYVAEHYRHLRIVMFEEGQVWDAILNVVPFALISVLFTLSRFSFGYLLGFYFYTMVLGYLWLVEFSQFHYDRPWAIVSACLSTLAFLFPALLITSPIKKTFVLSPRGLNFLLDLIGAVAAVAIAIGASYNFRFASLGDIYNFRDELAFPTLLQYTMGMLSGALLPFAFACFVAQAKYWRASAVLILLFLFYPVTLSKLSLFAPCWLLGIALLCKFFDARTSAILSLLVPITLGLALVILVQNDVIPFEAIRPYFGSVNFRMIAIPSSALDLYNDFFSKHDYTYFCQISFLKPLVDCPYKEQLSVVMQNAYGLGNFNASLFATEGIASVGLALSPVAVFICGLIISIGNRVSSELPARFVLLSSAMLPQIFLNVPLTTTLLTNGAASLFLLWYITPRSAIENYHVLADEPRGNVF